MSESPLRAALVKFADEVIYSARINLEATRRINGKKARRIATGNLRDDLTYQFFRRGSRELLIFTTKKKSTRDYADVIEEGRRPNSTPPPVGAILKWMKVKNIKLRSTEEGKKGQFVKGGKIKLRNVKDKEGKKKLRATDARYNAVAFLISRSIGRRGIQGINYMGSAIESTQDDYDDIFGDALLAEIDIRLKADKYIE